MPLAVVHTENAVNTIKHMKYTQTYKTHKNAKHET